MSSFNVEFEFRRFMILSIVGLFAILVFYLIARTHEISSSDSAPPITLSEPKSAPAQEKPASDSSATVTNLIPNEKSEEKNVNVTTSLVTESVSENTNTPVRVIFVDNSSTQRVKPEDGALFPKERCWLNSIRLFSSRPTGWGEGRSEDEDYTYGSEGRRLYYSSSIRFFGFDLSVHNGRLSASGPLTAPVLLIFEAEPPHPSILLWPSDFQAEFNADCDADGRITILSEGSILDLFAGVINADSNPGVHLSIASASAGCVTNFPLVGLEYRFACLAAALANAVIQTEKMQRQLDATAAFRKLFQATRSVSPNLTFWLELDQNCQFITQGRTGVLEYGFDGSAESRAASRRLVLFDLNSAPALASDTRKLFETTLTEDNLSAMAAIEPRLAWEKPLAFIQSELNRQKGKTQSTATGSIRDLKGEFRFTPGNSNPGWVTLGRLDFSGGALSRFEKIDRQIRVLEDTISRLGGGMNSSTMFYLSNPELARRYFPHLFKGAAGGSGGASPLARRLEMLENRKTLLELERSRER